MGKKKKNYGEVFELVNGILMGDVGDCLGVQSRLRILQSWWSGNDVRGKY